MLCYSCINTELDTAMQPRQQTRATVLPKVVADIEVSNTNPLNAGSYITSNGNPAIDMVILSTATIQGRFPMHPDITYLKNKTDMGAIVNNPSKYIQPLQEKGIKVLYAIEGDHTGLGFANLSDLQIVDFARKVVEQVNAAGLDGLFFRDEWSDYGSYGYPYANNTSYGKLILRLRELMPDKIISVKDIGYSSYLTHVMNDIDFGFYSYPSPTGFIEYPGMGLPITKWAPINIYLGGTNDRYAPIIKNNARKATEQGFGAILLTGLQGEKDHTVLMNAIINGSQGLTVTHNGEWFEKDW